MKISTRLYVTAAIPAVVVVTLMSLVVVFNSEVEHQMERHKLAMESNSTVADLKVLMYEYLSTHSERAEQQWFSRYDAAVSGMQQAVEVLELDQPTYSAFADLDDLFSEVAANQREVQQITQQEASQAKLDILMQAEQILTAQLLVNSEMIATDMALADENAYSATARAQQILGTATHAAMVFLVLTAIGVATFTTRSILSPLRSLAAYSQRVGAGEYTAEIEVKGKDEISYVAAIVKAMVGRLLAAQNKLRTQRDDLDDEIKERTAELTQTNRQLVAEITEHKQAKQSLQQTADRIERLLDTVHELELCEDEDQVYQLAIRTAEQTLSLQMYTLDIVEGGKLTVKEASPSGLLPEDNQVGEVETGGLALKTYRTGETIMFGSLSEVPEATPVREDICSGISAPIGDIGVFQVISTEPDAFTQNDARMLNLLLGHTYEAIRRIRLQQDLRHQAIHDPLTGVYNRRYFNEVIEQEIGRSKRYDHPIGFLMIDIDHFKHINDTYGHQTGDQVLQAVAKLLVGQVRGTDLVVRYGGDEFLLVLIETDGETEKVMERIRAAVAERNKTNELVPFAVTLSIGSAHWSPELNQTAEEILAEADRKMYAEKQSKNGRER